jgi:hypothetical protein
MELRIDEGLGAIEIGLSKVPYLRRALLIPSDHVGRVVWEKKPARAPVGRGGCLATSLKAPVASRRVITISGY